MYDPDDMRLALMDISEAVSPIREFVLGEIAYYEGQGFTKEQARAMAAAEFTSIFGLRILNSATEPQAPSGDPG